MDRLKAMRTFVCVVKEGSFRKAAAELGASPASVSKHVQDLEQSMGVELLRRTTRRVALTDVGDAYYEVCARLIGELDMAESSIREAQKDALGHLRILAPRSFGSAGFSTALATFVQVHPGLEVTLVLGDSTTHSFGSEGDVDVAIRLWDIPPDSTLVARQVGWMTWTICASPAYLLAAREPRTIEELASHHCLVHTRLTPDRLWRFNDGRSIRVAGPLAANSVLAIRRAALAGAGIAQLPSYYVKDDLAAGRLKEILTGEDIRKRPVYAVIPDRKNAPRRVSTFMAFFVEWARENL
jgi:DNA-binding transcriptional LysR family regulator